MKKLMFATMVAVMSIGAAQADCYSEGVRRGVVQKFSVKGIINKSWEGELVMDGLKIRSDEAGTRGGNVWKFSVTDPAVAKVIDQAAMTGQAVGLRYCQSMFNTGLTQNTGYSITQAALVK